MGAERKRWVDHTDEIQFPFQITPDPDLSKKDRRNLERDVLYWKDSSKRKDKEILLLQSTIRGLKSHITRQRGALHRKGVYKL